MHIYRILCLVVVYCAGGYIFNGYKSKNWGDIKSNIPNFGLWSTLPKATIVIHLYIN